MSVTLRAPAATPEQSAGGGCSGPLGAQGAFDASWLLLGVLPGLAIFRKRATR